MKLCDRTLTRRTVCTGTINAHEKTAAYDPVAHKLLEESLGKIAWRYSKLHKRK